jgi:hypothetical protein
MHIELAFIISGSAGIYITIFYYRVEWRMIPQIKGIDRLDVIVSIDKNSGLPGAPSHSA